MTAPRRKRAGGGPPPVNLLEALVDPRLEGAACAGRAPLFDERRPGEPDDHFDARLAAAQRICRTCQVSTACDAAATEQKHPTGIWAGQPHQSSDALRFRRKAS